MPLGGGSLHFAVGPAVSLAAIVLLLLMCRWVFGTGRAPARSAGHRPAAARPAPAPGEAYGLLVPVLSTPLRSEAEQVRDVLRGHGIRGTVVATTAGHEVRVFPDDAARARTHVDAA